MRLLYLVLFLSFVLSSCKEKEKSIEGLWLVPNSTQEITNHHKLFANITKDSIEIMSLGDKFMRIDYKPEKYPYSRDEQILIIELGLNNFDTIDFFFTQNGSLGIQIGERGDYVSLSPVVNPDSFLDVDLIGKTYLVERGNEVDTVSFLRENLAVVRNEVSEDWKLSFYRLSNYENIKIIYLDEGLTSILVLDSLKEDKMYFAKRAYGKPSVVFTELKDSISNQKFIGNWQTTYNWDPKYFDATKEWVDSFNTTEHLGISEDSVIITKNNQSKTTSWEYLPQMDLFVMLEANRIFNLTKINSDSIVTERIVNDITHEIVYHRINEKLVN